jgi:O-antigen ligase
MAAACAATAALAAVLWASSPYLRDRVQRSLVEVGAYAAGNVMTSGGLRLEFWRESIGFISTAPVLGHGTGSINGQFREGALARETSPAMATQSPHQQVLAIAIQLGLIGAGLLLAMWAAHLALFSGAGLTAWIGLTVVVQNVVSSQFNPHLFDFTEGWLYVFGVGVIGGMVRRAQAARAQATVEAEA